MSILPLDCEVLECGARVSLTSCVQHSSPCMQHGTCQIGRLDCTEGRV
jgi:hypothetical protein